MVNQSEGLRRLEATRSGGFQAFGKLLSWLERTAPEEIFALEEILRPKRFARRFGITGPPGAGKSTLVAGLIAEFRKLGLRVGVIAVDPSSPFSRGAILGDRIRYADHTLDEGVFIRSLGSRGSSGGLSGGAFVMARAFDVCDFDVLLIETVGVGQTELDVLHVADQVVVVLTPESGDGIQVMKAGLMEIAHAFVMNKADRPGAEALVRELTAAGDQSTVVYPCVATTGRGVPELAAGLLGGPKPLRETPARLRAEALALRRLAWERTIERELGEIASVDDFQRALVPK